jgi:NADH-ubiquinone oxidoreductase chain 4
MAALLPLSLLLTGATALAGLLRGAYAAQAASLAAGVALLLASVLGYALADGAGGLGALLAVLTGVVTLAALLAEWGGIRRGGAFYPCLVLLLAGCLYYLFGAGGLLSFYIGFELVLVPRVLVIGIWGSGAARIRAAFLFFLYTLVGSLARLACLVALWWGEPGPLLTGAPIAGLAGPASLALASGFALAFAVKTPLLPFHTWLFRAHAQAPVGGSVLLAGLVLKLSAWGVALVFLSWFPAAWAALLPAVLALASVSLVYSSLSARRQTDLKAVVAISSVGHRALSVRGLALAGGAGWTGGILLQAAHGLVSPALFVLVGGVLYERYHTLLAVYYRGLSVLLPGFSLLFLLARLANCATPPSLNWLSELLAIAGVLGASPLAALAAASSVLLGAGYTVWVFTRASYGEWSPALQPLGDAGRRHTALALVLVGLAGVAGPASTHLVDSLWAH